MKRRKREQEKEEEPKGVAMTEQTLRKNHARRIDYSNSTQTLYSCENLAQPTPHSKSRSKKKFGGSALSFQKIHHSTMGFSLYHLEWFAIKHKIKRFLVTCNAYVACWEST